MIFRLKVEWKAVILAKGHNDRGQKCTTKDTRVGLLQFLGWPEVLISFSLTLSHSVPRHYTSCRGGGLVLRVRECVSPAEAVPICSLVTGRLASAGIEPGTLCAGSECEATTPPSRHSQKCTKSIFLTTNFGRKFLGQKCTKTAFLIKFSGQK